MSIGTPPKQNLNLSQAVRFLMVALTGATGLLFVLASCRPAPKPGGPSLQAIRAEIAAHAGETVGNAACAPCHANECRVFATSAHANTLHLLDASTPSQLRPPEGRIGNTPFVIRHVADRYFVEFPEAVSSGVQLGEAQEFGHFPLQVVYSAGKKGLLYGAGVDGTPQATFRYAYLPQARQWLIAPGVGNDLPANQPARIKRNFSHPNCVDCHALPATTDGSIPARERMGVGCESCHGPGGAHVIAMQRHQWSEMHIDALHPNDAIHVMRACEPCHTGEFDEKERTNPKLRAAMVAAGQDLSMGASKCYQASMSKMSCLTCHSAHTDASTSPAFYEAICLSCHGPSGHAGGLAAADTVAGKRCPVNAKTGCISCHMPPRKPRDPELRTARSVNLTNHCIAIYKSR